ncbi:hypothetical protein ACPPVS_08910 [Cellulomonas sp. McL0617]|uniref:hypothetical protein n=1 Tax=Cellulomonas sp. McL0617 TaxID=3415675 RepID=UPI003CFAEF24
MPDPQVGEMVLYDYIRPPLLAGAYRMRVETDVAIAGAPQDLPGQDYFFDVEGPRFSLAPSEVAGVFPPRNGHGPFDSALPHVALGRRTLPWERPLGDAYTVGPDDTPYPFLALVLFEASECELKRNQALTDVVPADVFQRLGRPDGIRCDAVEADLQLLRDILPMPDELRLLTHVRQVNVDDRELAAGDSDGYFAVVMGNRIPRSGSSYVACLVSVEERTDLLPTTDVVEEHGWETLVDAQDALVSQPFELSGGSLGTGVTAEVADTMVQPMQGRTTTGTVRSTTNKAAIQSAVEAAPARASSLGVTQAASAGKELIPAPAAPPGLVGAVAAASQDAFLPSSSTAHAAVLGQSADLKRRTDAGMFVLHPKARLVLLHSWTFVCEGDGTFRQLMQGLDVAMAGEVAPSSTLAVADTGHIRIDVVDRLGAPEQSWYRGPFVSQPVSRDPLGPYHSADQARRVVAETGAENISYASAFEVGRLLAAADGRLAQELMRWRRGAYRSSTQDTSRSTLVAAMRLVEVTDPLDPVALRFAVDVLTKVTAGIGPLGDPLLRERVLSSPLLGADALTSTFGLRSKDAIRTLLGADAGLTGAVALPPLGKVPPTSTLDQILKDSVGLAALAEVRSNAIAAVAAPKLRLEGPG